MRKALLGIVLVVAALAGIGALAGDDGGGNGDRPADDLVTTTTRPGAAVSGAASEAAAGCLPVRRTLVPRVPPQHRNPPIEYAQAPPDHGDHSALTLRNAKRFYSRDDAPAPEQAVHNLEHGLVVAWYDDELPDSEVAVLEDVSQGISRRFVAVPWSRGSFEGGRHFVLTAWGHTQRCERVSPEVIRKFVADHADKHGPENGAPV